MGVIGTVASISFTGIAVALFVAVQKGRIDDKTIARAANVAGVVSLFIAIFALFVSLPPTESTPKPTISKPTNTVAVSLSPPTSTLKPTSTSVFSLASPTPKVLPHTPTPTSALRSTEVVVQSTQERNQTGLYIDNGQLVTIEWVGGSWRAGPLPTWPFYGPSGDPQTPSKETFPVRDKPIVSLVAGIGNSQPFWVGPNIQFESTVSGELWLGANDDNFTDNDGSLTVIITIGD